MEAKLKQEKSIDIPELHEIEEDYYGCLDMNGFEEVKKIPSLKYCVYNYKISNVFLDKIEQIKNDISALKNRVRNYSRDLLDIDKENKEIENIVKDLDSLYKKELDDELFFRKYLLSVAKRSDVLKNECANKVYADSSEEVIFSRIKYFIKNEKKFLIYNDIIKQMNSLF